jgi:hypothetical protein
LLEVELFFFPQDAPDILQVQPPAADDNLTQRSKKGVKIRFALGARKEKSGRFPGLYGPGLPQADIPNPWSPFDSARCLDLCFLTMVGGEN